MSKLNIPVFHRKPKDIALERMKKLFSALKEEQADKMSDLTENWVGDECQFSFTLIGINVDGRLTVKERQVILDGNIPWNAAVFKDRISTIILDRAETMLK